MRHQDNHVALSRKIRDAVSGIAVDGVKATSSLRNIYLNRANVYIQQQIWQTRDAAKIGKYLNGLIKTQTFTFSTSGTTKAADVSYPIAAQLDGKTQLDYADPAIKFNLDTNPLYERSVFLISGGKIYGYNRGVAIASGAGTLEYIQLDKQTTTDANPAIDALWDTPMVDIAATFFWEDAGKMTSVDAENRRKLAIASVVQ